LKKIVGGEIHRLFFCSILGGGIYSPAFTAGERGAQFLLNVVGKAHFWHTQQKGAASFDAAPFAYV
jgi:hypothetical protein